MLSTILVERRCAVCHEKFQSMSEDDARCSFCAGVLQTRRRRLEAAKIVARRKLEELARRVWQDLASAGGLNAEGLLQAAAMAERLGCPKHAVYPAVSALVGRGVLAKTGRGRWTRYRLMAAPDSRGGV